MSRGRPTARLTGVCLLLLGSLDFPSAASHGSGGVRELLERRRAEGCCDEECCDDERLLHQLGALGPEATGEILGLCSGRIPSLGQLESEERELLVAALRSRPRAEVVRALAEALPPQPALDERLAALRLVGEVGGRGTIAAVEVVGAGLPPEELVHPLWGAEVQRTILGALRRDGETYRELERRIERGELSPELEEHAARALGAAGLGRGLPLLEGLFGRGENLDLTLLEALGRLRPFDDPATVVEARALARGQLSAGSARLRRQAALALGSLRDGEAVPELLSLLGDTDRRVQRGAQEALVRLSGLDLGPDAGPWTRWFEEELLWLESELAPRVEELASAEAACVLAALRQLCVHPLHRDLVAEEIRALLAHRQPLVAVAACSALVKLDDVGAFAPLLSALADPRDEVREAAGRSLDLLTGVSLGLEPEAWLAWLLPGEP